MKPSETLQCKMLKHVSQGRHPKGDPGFTGQAKTPSEISYAETSSISQGRQSSQRRCFYLCWVVHSKNSALVMNYSRAKVFHARGIVPFATSACPVKYTKCRRSHLTGLARLNNAVSVPAEQGLTGAPLRENMFLGCGQSPP